MVQPNTGPMPPTHAPRTARIALAEDDAASREYLADAMRGFGAQVTACSDGEQALAAASDKHFDLLLLDQRLPLLNGEEVLRQLRANPAAASRHCRAIATSAHWDRSTRAAARGAGFADTLAKPCTTADLRTALRRHLPPETLALRDDAAALARIGDSARVQALRRLFVRELEQWLEEWPQLATRRAELDARLHRLFASSGFCGAPALTSATQALRCALEHDGAAGSSAVGTRFIAVLGTTLRHFAAAGDG